MNTRKIIYDTFLKPFETKKVGNIGVELEFPLINKANCDVDTKFARGIFDLFLKDGFKTEIADKNGNPLFIINKFGDCISFDNSYNNFEFSLNYGDNLLEIKERFDVYFKKVNDYFNSNNHTLVGLGTNPNKKYISQNHVGFDTYKMVNEYLSKIPGKHEMSDFPAYLSSVQTHLDVNLKDLPKAYTLFSKLDFARAILFSNSPDFDDKGYLCYRDYLWENSGFGAGKNITGKIDEEFTNTDDIIEFFCKKSMFNRIRDGKYETFKPVNIVEYFENPKYEAIESDINEYLSFKNVEITRRGTLEIRSDCAQPFFRAFAPPAFNLGILENIDEAIDATEGFFDENNIELSNTELRNIVISGKKLSKICDEDFLSDFLYDLIEIASEGLEKRGKGEEIFLSPLYKNAVTLIPPAKSNN